MPLACKTGQLESEECAFLCGACSNDADLIDPTSLMKWSRGEARLADGSLPAKPGKDTGK